MQSRTFFLHWLRAGVLITGALFLSSGYGQTGFAVPEQLQPDKNGKSDATLWADYLSSILPALDPNTPNVKMLLEMNTQNNAQLKRLNQFDQEMANLDLCILPPCAPNPPAPPARQLQANPMPYFDYHHTQLTQTIAWLRKQNSVDYQQMAELHDGILQSVASPIGSVIVQEYGDIFTALVEARHFSAPDSETRKDYDGDIRFSLASSTKTSPFAPSGASDRDPALTRTLDISVTSTGKDDFKWVKVEITTSKPIALSLGDYDRYKTVLYQGGYQPVVSCSIKSPQTIACEAYESEWVKLTFNVEDFSEDPLETQRTILANVSALDPEDGEWIPLGSKSGPVFAKNCDSAYEITLKAHNTDALQALLQKHTKPVDSLPGKRFYPGPTEGHSMNAATTFKIKTLTDIVAENRLRDTILALHADGTKGDLNSYIKSYQKVLATPQCSAVDAHFAEFERMSRFSNQFHRRALEIDALSHRARSQTEIWESGFKAHIKGLSGELPKPLQVLLGVGGSNNADVETIVREYHKNLISSASSSAIIELGFFIIANSAKAGGYTSTLATRAPTAVSLLMLGAQYATIIVDTIHLVAANTSKENIYAWMEADAYLELLANRYETISAPFRTHADGFGISALSRDACTCQ